MDETQTQYTKLSVVRHAICKAIAELDNMPHHIAILLKAERIAQLEFREAMRRMIEVSKASSNEP